MNREESLKSIAGMLFSGETEVSGAEPLLKALSNMNDEELAFIDGLLKGDPSLASKVIENSKIKSEGTQDQQWEEVLKTEASLIEEVTKLGQ